MSQTRRDFLKTVGTGSLGLLTAGAILPRLTRAAAPKDTRPNILFAMADDQSWPHAGAYGCRAIQTPAFDRVAREGVLFNNAFCAAPQCSPNRAAILTGRNIGQLEEAGTHASNFPRKYQVYPDLLEAAGYTVGFTGKGWGPGNWQYTGWARNPAGPEYGGHQVAKPPAQGISALDYAACFEDFLNQRAASTPFCFWFGCHEPHRGYEAGSGIRAGKRPANVTVPGFLPDTAVTRSDLLDYFVEVEWFDQQVGRMLALLEQAGVLENTLVVVTSDNGMPFPRAKANLYEYGTHMPLAIRWPAQVPGGRVVDDLTNSIDFAPTFLAAAGVEIPAQVTGQSLLPTLQSTQEGVVDASRAYVITGRERHTHARPDNLGYPARAIRTEQYLYIRNFAPDRWPAGNPSGSGEPPFYHDIDGGPTKRWMIDHQSDPAVRDLFHLGFGKRPLEELYDIQHDPYCLTNLAGQYAVRQVQADCWERLDHHLRAQLDPRAFGDPLFETYPRYSRMRAFPGFKTRGAYNLGYSEE